MQSEIVDGQVCPAAESRGLEALRARRAGWFYGAYVLVVVGEGGGGGGKGEKEVEIMGF